MKNLALSLGVPLAFTLGTLVAHAQGGEGIPPVGRVGCVDLDLVAKGYKKAHALRNELDDLSVKLNAELKEEQKKVAALQMTIDRFEALTPKWIQARAAFAAAKQAQDERYQLNQRRLKLLVQKNRVEVFHDIEAAIAQVAKAMGVSVVLRVRSFPAGASADMKDLVYSLRDTLYHDPLLDLTEKVISILPKS